MNFPLKIEESRERGSLDERKKERERERETGRGPRDRFLGYSALHQGCMRVASRAEETLTTTPSSNASVAMKTQVGAREWKRKLERRI